VIQRELVDRLAIELLEGRITEGQQVTVDLLPPAGADGEPELVIRAATGDNGS